MREPVIAYIGLGANLGNREAAVQGAIARIGELPSTRVLRVSSMHETKPHDASGPDFINAVAQVETRLDAMALLAALQSIEDGFGRERPYRNAPRTLDLDLLIYGSGSIDSAKLVVPHPRMHERDFVLEPLAEIAPELASRSLPRA